VVAGEQGEAAELVALPLADLGAGQVADVVDVEYEQRAEVGVLQGLLGAAEAIAMQPPEIDARLEIDVGVARCRQLGLPVPMRIRVGDGGIFGHEPGFAGPPLVHRALSLGGAGSALAHGSRPCAPCRAPMGVSIDAASNSVLNRRPRQARSE